MNEKLRDIICDVFRIEPERYRPDLASAEVDAWDSVMHITLLLTLEQSFGVTFEPEEGAEMTSIEAIRSALARHGATDAD
ncbi:MAG: acyl carrier protein [bacterium]|nr:acyl carrier protein [bacterium]